MSTATASLRVVSDSSALPPGARISQIRPVLGSLIQGFRFDGKPLKDDFRAMLRDLPAALAEISGDRDRLEAAFVAQVDAAFPQGPEALVDTVFECWREAEVFEERWARAFLGRGSAGASRHARSWARLNHVAGMPRT